MPEPITLVVELIRWIGDHLSLRYFSMLFLMCVAFLFGINPALRNLGLSPVASIYHVWAACGAVITGAGMLFSFLEKICMRISSVRKAHKQEIGIRDHLRNLPTDQMQILSRYAQTGKSSLSFDEYQGAVCDLERRGILYRSSNVPHRGLGTFPYTITPVALRYMQQPEIKTILQGQKVE